MSLLRNLLGNFMPHFEARTSTGTLAALNAEFVHDLNGDEAALINLTGNCTVTYNVEGSADGVNYFPLLCFPYGTASVGGTIPYPAQPLIAEAVGAINLLRVLSTATGQLKKIRVRLSAYTSGSMTVVINSDSCAVVSPYVRDQKAATLMITATAGAGVAVTARLPAVAGLRHYIDRISVVRSATAALTAAAAPVVVTTSNIGGLPALTFGSDAGGVGSDKEQIMEFGGAGMACIYSGLETTITCPVWTNVIWRVNVVYRLGM